MQFISSLMGSLPEYTSLRSQLAHLQFPAAATGLSHIHKAAVISSLCGDLDRKALFIAADESEASRFYEDIQALGVNAVYYPSRDYTFRDMAGVSREYEHMRIGALRRIADGDYTVAVCCAVAACQLTVPKNELNARTFTVENGAEMPVGTIIERLLSAGYTRSDMVEGAGQFAVRGGIIDIFPPHLKHPVRIEFWGDTVDSLSLFDTESQRRTDMLDSVTVSPACEVVFAGDFIEKVERFAQKLSKKHSEAKEKLLSAVDAAKSGVFPQSYDKYLPLAYEKSETLLDYVSGEMIFLSELNNIKERLRTSAAQQNEDMRLMFEDGTLTKGLDRYRLTQSEFFAAVNAAHSVYTDTFARGSYGTELASAVNFNLRQTTSWRGSVSQLADDLIPMLKSGYTVALLAGNPKAAQNLADELCELDIDAAYNADPPFLRENAVTVTLGALSSGFESASAKFAVITRDKYMGAKPVSRRSKYKKGAQINGIEELHRGDYIVHSAHGIGIFDGIHKISNDGITKDYIKINYAKQDVLYVPVTQLDLVSKYIGNTDDGAVKLNRLGGEQWQKTRSRVKAAVRDMAKQLIKLYSQRMAVQGHAFLPDTDLQSDFESRFEYDETDDQLRCISEIKSDMERAVPMDRLLCGDVGVGKTEVALRAAFKCIAEGKQCALLCPTTILAWQHYQTVTRRMEGMPVEIELLSRFRTAKQQTEILKRLKSGRIDMVIGTHRLVSKDVEFKDLGLIIIDEEQRFGVEQKERLKELCPSVDVLTMSATPIPRTLNMAMSGLRDMSSIDEAPSDRLPVQTYVVEHDLGVLIDAINREIRRGGQVYYLHNRVEDITLTAAKLKQRLPDCSIGIAHGKMNEEELSEVWRKLIDREIDILVCTTIIETGVDVPNANTLIIEDADRFGLSQLHQLRGRVGRSPRRAYAYLTFRGGKGMSDIAQKRLEAIREFTEFGSGYKIAMRDLELRGAGNLLGGEQHGHMDSVGYDMYLKLLADAVSEEKGEKPQSPAECTVDLPITAHIPEDYIPDLPQRLGIYRRIADIRSTADSEDVIDELCDRFGDLPPSVNGLITVALLRNRAAALGITAVEYRMGAMRLYPTDLDMRLAGLLSAAFSIRFAVAAGTKPYYNIAPKPKQPPLKLLDEFLTAAENAAQQLS